MGLNLNLGVAEKISQFFSSRSDLPKLLFSVETVPAAVQQHFITRFQPESNNIGIVETFGVISELMNWTFLMGFYFCGQDIHIEGEDKEM